MAQKPKAPPKDDPPTLPPLIWARLRHWFPNSARHIWVAALALMAVVGAVLATYSVWKPIVDNLQSPLRIISVDPAREGAGVLDVVLKNTATTPMVLTVLQLEVASFQKSDLSVGGSSSLPVTGQYNALLTPRLGSRSPVEHSPIQILPNAAERIQLVLRTLTEDRAPWIDYRLVLRVQLDGTNFIASRPFEALVPTLR